jgi:hypothetical protein
MEKIIVIGRDANGETFYYTGRAGKAFVSTDINEAFAYPLVNPARNRATILNAGTAIHGIRFFVPAIGEK